MSLTDVFDAAPKKDEPQGLKPGDEVIAYHKDKWRPGTLVELGRKWAYVRLPGNDFKSRVPVGAVMPALRPQESEPPAPQPEPVATGGLTQAKEDGWWKIRRGGRLIALLPGAYDGERKVIFEALQLAEEDV